MPEHSCSTLVSPLSDDPNRGASGAIQEQESGLDRIEAVNLADDASLDKTVDVAKDAWRSSVRLQIMRNRQNQGERRTVNAAVRQFPASARWFFILHADDIAKPKWLATMLRVQDAASSEIASVTASYDVLHSDGRLLQGENRGENQLVLVEGQRKSITGHLLRGCWWKISSCSIRVSAFLQVDGFALDCRNSVISTLFFACYEMIAFEPTRGIAARLRAEWTPSLHIHDTAVLSKNGQATLKRFRGELGTNEAMNFIS
jgi:hypothetical protein